MAKRYYSEHYKQTGEPNRPPIVNNIETDKRPDVDHTPDTEPVGPGKPKDK